MDVKHPLTERIEVAVARRGMSGRTAAALCGLTEATWRRRAKAGSWQPDEIDLIARAAKVTPEWLIKVVV